MQQCCQDTANRTPKCNSFNTKPLINANILNFSNVTSSSRVAGCACRAVGSRRYIRELSRACLRPPSKTLTTTYNGKFKSPYQRGHVLVEASRAVVQYGRYGSPANRPQPWQVVSAVCAVALLLCNFHRSVFTSLLPLVVGSLALTPTELGLVQSSMLWGYLAGQVPAGKLADERGGDRVLLGGLALWSLATAATAAAAAATSSAAALAALVAARVAMGLFSAVIMPAVSAAAAQWVPRERKAATLALIYAFFNLGGVVGFIVAPHLAARGGGWPAAFVTAAAGGLLWAGLGTAAVARAGPRPPLPSQRITGPQPPRVLAVSLDTPPPASLAASARKAPPPPTTTPLGAAGGVNDAPMGPSSATGDSTGSSTASGSSSIPRSEEPASRSGGTADPWVSGSEAAALRQRTLFQVAALCWCHGVIGWGFFVLQSWVPLYMQSLGVADLETAGLLASLPWLAAAVTATAAGGLADRLVRSDRTTRLAVRRGMHAVSTLGCAAAVLPLAAAPAGSLPPAVATLCLVAAVGCYGFSFGGFHAYVQDVAAADAGQILGITNTASILGGIAGNLATGAVLQATGGYGAVFWVAAALYGTSWLCFLRLLHGEPISLAGLARRRSARA